MGQALRPKENGMLASSYKDLAKPCKSVPPDVYNGFTLPLNPSSNLFFQLYPDDELAGNGDRTAFLVQVNSGIIPAN